MVICLLLHIRRGENTTGLKQFGLGISKSGISKYLDFAQQKDVKCLIESINALPTSRCVTKVFLNLCKQVFVFLCKCVFCILSISICKWLMESIIMETACYYVKRVFLYLCKHKFV